MSHLGRDMAAFGAAALVLGVAAVTGSLPLFLISILAVWAVAHRLLPRGGLLAALAIALLWSNAAVVTTARLGAPELVATAPQVILAVAVAARLWVYQRPVVATPAFRALLVHVAAVMASALVAIDHAPVVTELQTIVIEGLVLWFLVVNAASDRRAVERMLAALVVTAGFLGALSVVQYASGTTDQFLGFAQLTEEQAIALENRDGPARLAGPVGEKNRYAQILLVVVPMAVAVARRRHGAAAAVAWVAVGACFAGLALTASRGATLALLVVVVLMAGFRLLTVRSLAALALAGAVALAVLPGYRDRIVSSVEATQADDLAEVDGSALSRITENLAAYQMWVDHPLLGVGPGGYRPLYQDYAEPIGLNVRDQEREPHNLYLDVAAETGTVGLVSFLAVVALVLRSLHRAWRAARTLEPGLAGLAAGSMVAIFAYLVSGVFLHLSYERYLWGLLALADAVARAVRAGARPPSTEETTAATAVPRPAASGALRAGLQQRSDAPHHIRTANDETSW